MPSSKNIRLWHPGVHRRVREQLCYFLVKMDGFFSSDFEKYFQSTIADKLQLASYCLYEIYGTFDVLIRLWINPIHLADFLELLSDSGKVKAVAEFKSEHVLLYWCFPDVDTCPELQGVTKEDLLAVERNEDIKKHFIERGLLVELPPSHTNNSIKFFISISAPTVIEQSAQDNLVKQLQHVVKDNDAIDNRSMYVGTGCMWVLIKATTKNIHDIRNLVYSIASKIEPYGSRTTTYIVATNHPLEKDGIGMGTISAMEAWDPAIDAWLPELYRDIKPGDPLKSRMETFLREHLLKTTLTEDDDVQMKNFFRSIVHKQKPMATAFGMELFSRMEALLRESLGRFLAHVFGPNKVAETLAEFKMPMEPKRMTLKEVLGSYKRTFQHIGKAEELMPSKPDQIESSRNGLAHGWKDPIDSWQEVGEALFEIVVKGRNILDYAEQYTDKSNKA